MEVFGRNDIDSKARSSRRWSSSNRDEAETDRIAPSSFLRTRLTSLVSHSFEVACADTSASGKVIVV